MRSTPMESRITGDLPVCGPGGGSVVPSAIDRRFRASRLCLSVGIIVAVTLSAAPSLADQLEDLTKKAGIRILSDGNSTNDLQKQTTAAIPLSALTPPNRARAQKILDNCSQYRRLPSLQYTIDEPIFRYLMQHPDVAVSTWRVMGISRFEMLQTGPQEFEARAVDGSEGIADILCQDQNQMLFICDGDYHHVLLPRPLQAAALIWFRADYGPNAEGTQVVTQKVDVFVRFPSAGFSTVAKILAPVTNSMMDRNLFEISLYGSMMSRAVQDEPEWIVQVARQLEGVLPQRRDELIAVARLPRPMQTRVTAKRVSVESADRSLIMSPQLLFFDPPKDRTTAPGPKSVVPSVPVSSAEETSGSAPLSAPPVSSATAEITPGARATAAMLSPRISAVPRDQTKKQPEAEFELQPAVPPAGPTATGPVGSGPTDPGQK